MENPSKTECEHLLEDLPKQEVPLRSRWIGLFLAILAGLCSTLYKTFFKMIKSIPICEIMFLDGACQLIFDAPFLLANRVDLRGPSGNRLFVWFAALLYCLSTWLTLYSVKLFPLGDALTINYTAPIFIMIFGSCFLKEPCSLLKISTLLIFVIALILLLKPPGVLQIFGILENETQEHFEVYGYVVAFGGAILYALIYMLSQVIMTDSSTDQTYLLIFSNAITLMMASAILTPIISTYTLPDSYQDLLWALLFGLFSSLSSLFRNYALKIEKASVVCMVRSLDIVFAYLVQVVWFGKMADATSLVGAALIGLCVIVIMQEEYITLKIGRSCQFQSDGRSK